MRRRTKGLLLLLPVLAVVASCGDDDDDASSAPSSPAPVPTTAATGAATPSTEAPGTGPKESLTVATTGAVVSFAPFFLAQQAGFFEDAGLDVNYIIVDNSAIAAAMVSGQADLAMSATGSVLGIASQGKDTVMLYNLTGGGAGMWIAGKSGITDPTQCTKVNTAGPGSSLYTSAVFLRDLFHADYDINDGFGDSSLALGAAMAGQGDCHVGPPFHMSELEKAGKMKTIFDPRDTAKRPEGFPGQMVEAGIWSLSEPLEDEAKLDAVGRLLFAIDRAANEIAAVETPQQVAARLQELNDFKAADTAKLTSDYTVIRDFDRPNDGYISEEVWDQTLVYLLGGQALKTTADDPVVQYANRVDVRPYERELGTP